MKQVSRFLDDLEAAANGLRGVLDDVVVVLKSEMAAKEPERNADGDTLEDMKAMQDRFGAGSIEVIIGLKWYTDTCPVSFGLSARDYRITAKHSDTFIEDIMDFEVWARAAIGRGMVLRNEKDGIALCFDSCCSWGVVSIQRGGSSWAYAATVGGWTAITRAQYEQETKPKEPKPEPQPSRYTPSEENGIKSVYDRKGKYTLAICLHSFQDCHRIAKAMNEAEARKVSK